MALSRIGSSADFATLFSRSTYAATNNARHTRQNIEQKLHASVIRQYPEAPQIPLPSNVSEIFNIETSRFAPERARDIAAPIFLYNRNPDKYSNMNFCSNNSVKMHQMDSHVDSYDCFGSVSLNSSMQTNVPKPFCSSGKSTYLNMPGGQWARDGKYLAEIMKKNHFTVYKMRHLKRNGQLDGLLNVIVSRCFSTTSSASYSTTNDTATSTNKTSGTNKGADGKQSDPLDAKSPADLTKRERLKILIRDYGRTVIVFHITISLISLGLFYSLVSSGLDITPLIQVFSDGPSAEGGEDKLVKMIMSEGSTFLIAYAVHKLFAPIRITMTLAFTPVIVKYLRRKGILKTPKPTSTKPS